MLTTKSDMARHVRTFVARVNYETSPLIFLAGVGDVLLVVGHDE